MEPIIRRAVPDDAQAVHDLYGYYVEHSIATFSTENPSVAEYRAKIERITSLYPFYLLEQEGRVLGFAYGDRLRPHDAYLWDVEATLYLAPDAPRRRGYGTLLYQELIAMLRKQGFQTVFGVITDQNAPSLALHRALGFIEVGRFPRMGYKHGQWLGIVWMELELAAFEGAPVPPVPFAQVED